MLVTLALATIIASTQLAAAPQQIRLVPTDSAVVAIGVTNEGPTRQLLFTASPNQEDNGLQVQICPAIACPDPGIEASVLVSARGASSFLLVVKAPANIAPGPHWIWVSAYDEDWKLESVVTVTVMVP